MASAKTIRSRKTLLKNHAISPSTHPQVATSVATRRPRDDHRLAALGGADHLRERPIFPPGGFEAELPHGIGNAHILLQSPTRRNFSETGLDREYVVNTHLQTV